MWGKSAMFSTAQRTLDADGFRGTTLGVLLVIGLLGAWGAWFIGAQVALYAVSDTARLEMSQAAHPVEAPVAGRVVATHLVLGQEVQGGDALVDLDATAQQLQLEEEQARLRALTPQLEALRTAIVAEEQALRDSRHAGRVALDEARARHREAEVAARAADEEAELFTRLQARGLPAQLDALCAKAEAQKRRAAADTLRLVVSRVEGDHRTQESDRKARLEGLRRDVTRLTGEMATAAATVERLTHEIERRRIRAPMAGRLGEVAGLRIGSVVSEGDRLAAVVPYGELTVVADFPPPSALGRIRPGQSARLRLEGFPWT
jgi:multidrug resistance efflux pump